MKTIGILGGMSAESTVLYYQRLNSEVQRRLGGLHSADLLIRSFDFAEIEQLQQSDDWSTAGQLLNEAAKDLEGAGADLLVLATNTMHKVAGAMLEGVKIPFVHIGDATAEAINEAGLTQPGLMATAYTMEQDFYTGRLRKAGLNPIVPRSEDRIEIHRIIFDELCKGQVLDASRRSYEAIAARLVAAGADCLILGCTEIGLLLNDRNVDVPVFDTTLIHCDAALQSALR